MGTLTTEQVLRDEASAIRGATPVETESALYRDMNGLGLSALCLSGGGIRSAAFALGVIQALATHPRSVRDKAASNDQPIVPQSLLTQFDYMSTVSGGGYIGSWLSAWRRWHPFSEICPSLVGRPSGPDAEPHVLAWLRSYSNYLTPKTGLTSADTWAAAGLALRNLLLNWLVILTPICAFIFLLKLIGVASNWTIHWDDGQPWPPHWTDAWRAFIKPALELGSGIAGVACIIMALAITTRSRPTSRAPEDRGPDQMQFLKGTILWSLLSAFLLVHFLASDLIGNALLLCKGYGSVATAQLPICPADQSGKIPWVNVTTHPAIMHIVAGVVYGALTYCAGWLVARPQRQGRFDLLMWMASGGAYGALVAAGLYVYLVIPDTGVADLPINFFHLVFGVPFLLLAQLVADTIFASLSSYEPASDADREWFGRSFGWFLTIATLWLVISFLVYFGTILGAQALDSKQWAKVKAIIPIVAAVAGWITATFGKSAASPVKGEAKGTLPYLGGLILPVAATLFSAALLVIISYLLDLLLFGQSLVDAKQTQALFLPLFGGLLVSVVLGTIASRCININRFSLHAIYRNRLVRAFLGAARNRKPDAFTGFDLMDNPLMHELWSPRQAGNWRPFHIINIALNVVSSNRLAWQERKAEPFTVSPLHSGSSRLGYRETREYGGQDGISLGTAMAISGAAASPNMGYHSSPSVTFLMSMLNVRLGWWLGNPGDKGNDSYRKEGPDFAILPLLTEAFGLTTDDRKYVYLSDGGHFENLGLYEMVRRRCRFIVVSDASCDPDFAFQDLGNTTRKIAIDLGISIRFKNLDRLKIRSDEPLDGEHIYHAIGEIDYRAADGGGSNGYVLYIKAAYHGIEMSGPTRRQTWTSLIKAP